MPLECPRCPAVLLEDIELDDVVLDRCPRCAGVWFDNDEIAQVVGPSEEVRRIEAAIPEASEVEEGAEIYCPRCLDVPLRRLEMERGDGRVRILHRCASCMGTWIDRGELRAQEDPRLSEALKGYFGLPVGDG